jgi:hypothetical protein
VPITLSQLADRLGARLERTRVSAGAVRRLDDWESLTTGRNVLGRDRRRSYYHVTDHLTSSEAYDLWQGNWLAARGIEIWPDEMFREGWDLRLNDDDGRDRADEIEQECEDLGLDDALWLAYSYKRAYGGGAVLLGANDGAGSLAEPLREDRVQTLEFLLPLEASELHAASWYGGRDLGPKIGKPRTYWLQPFTSGGEPSIREEIHESRLLILDGVRVSRRQWSPIPGWGTSVLSRVAAVIRDYGLSWGSAAEIMQTFNRSEVKIQGLYELFATNQDDQIVDRMRALSTAREVFGFDLLDADEEINDKARTVTGYAELLDGFGTQVASAFDVPVSRLTGKAPAGMNATGEFDQKAWYDRVGAQQEKELEPAIKKTCRLIMRARGEDPDQISINFRPLVKLSDLETAQARKAQAEVDEKYVDMGALSPMDVARSRWGGDDYSFETTVDFKELEASIEETEAEARAVLEQMSEPSADPGEDVLIDSRGDRLLRLYGRR